MSADTLETFVIAEPAHRCSCGQGHTQAEWDALPFVGYCPDYEGGWLCLRNCDRCGSTRAQLCTTTPPGCGDAPDFTVDIFADTEPSPPPVDYADLEGFVLMTGAA